jgi:hypothetical protein
MVSDNNRECRECRVRITYETRRKRLTGVRATRFILGVGSETDSMRSRRSTGTRRRPALAMHKKGLRMLGKKAVRSPLEHWRLILVYGADGRSSRFVSPCEPGYDRPCVAGLLESATGHIRYSAYSPANIRYSVYSPKLRRPVPSFCLAAGSVGPRCSPSQAVPRRCYSRAGSMLRKPLPPDTPQLPLQDRSP